MKEVVRKKKIKINSDYQRQLEYLQKLVTKELENMTNLETHKPSIAISVTCKEMVRILDTARLLQDLELEEKTEATKTNSQ